MTGVNPTPVQKEPPAAVGGREVQARCGVSVVAGPDERRVDEGSAGSPIPVRRERRRSPRCTPRRQAHTTVTRARARSRRRQHRARSAWRSRSRGRRSPAGCPAAPGLRQQSRRAGTGGRLGCRNGTRPPRRRADRRCPAHQAWRPGSPHPSGVAGQRRQITHRDGAHPAEAQRHPRCLGRWITDRHVDDVVEDPLAEGTPGELGEQHRIRRTRIGVPGDSVTMDEVQRRTFGV